MAHTIGACGVSVEITSIFGDNYLGILNFNGFHSIFLKLS